MNIVKRLSLNKTPKDIPNGSIACGKNIMIDDTGSFITNDIGLIPKFFVTDPEKIVGVIPCINEVVIFTYTPAQGSTAAVSKIYRFPDGAAQPSEGPETFLVNNAKWNWSGGKITGSYTYNYKGELIIAVAEYDAYNNYGIEKYVPLKSFNLDTCSDDQTYNIEEEIPNYTGTSNITPNGSLLCGVYTFFIRFKLDNYNYTKWFQVSGDINIVQSALSKRYYHQYLNGNNELANPASAGSFTVNTNKISNKAISLKIELSDDNLPTVQLGYIFKRDAEVLGRIQGDYSGSYVSGTYTINADIVNNKFLEEISVDEFLENPHQFYNVKNAITYNNRLYIANYKEYPIEDLSSNTVSITSSDNHATSDSSIPSINSNNTSKTWNLTLTLVQDKPIFTGANQYDYETVNINIPFVVTDKNGYVVDKWGFINAITSKLYHYSTDIVPDGRLWGSYGFNYYLFLQNKPTSLTVSGTTVSRCLVDDAICISSYLNDASSFPPPSWGWNFNIPDYKIKIVANENSATITFEYNNKTWNLPSSGDNDTHCCILVHKRIFYYKSNGDIDHEGNVWYFGNSFAEESGPGFYDWKPVSASAPSSDQHVGRMPHDIHISISAVSATTNSNIDDTPNPGTNDSSGNFSSSSVSETAGANTRTLHPYQKYNFFIHYLRRDGSFTPGFNITSTLYDRYIASGSSSRELIIPGFKVVAPSNNDYVGYFITYEDIESTVDCVYVLFSEGSTTKTIGLTNAQYLYDLDVIRGSSLKIHKNNSSSYTIDNTLMYIRNGLNANHVEFKTSDTIATRVMGYVIKNVTNLYKNKIKVLYRLTKNIYNFNLSNDDAYVYIGQDYLPAFYTTETIIEYLDKRDFRVSRGFIIDPASNYVIGFDSVAPGIDDKSKQTKVEYEFNVTVPSMYAPYPLSAMNIKQDFQQAAVSLEYKTSNDKVSKNDVFVNSIISPDKLHDFLELQPCYMAKPSKSYTNYNSSNTNVFGKTIYRSDVVSDESLVNGFRHFGVNEYKNILENKGNITNIVGVGLYFLVHTEYSLFVFDRNHRLTRNAQFDIPDTFDVKYQEVMPSNEGFGGLLHKEEAILTKHGYIWYDFTNRIIFCYEDGKVSMLSGDINNFLKAIPVLGVRFAEDIDNSRLFVCIQSQKPDVEHEGQYVSSYITLSYNFNTKTFISTHDFRFSHNYRTYNTSYLFDETVHNRALFGFDYTTNAQYSWLTNRDNYYFPVYTDTRTVGSHQETFNASYIDIIFNSQYERTRVLEFITYILNEINETKPYSIVEGRLNRRFSGDIIRIYTDETDSGDLDVNVNPDKLNAVSPYTDSNTNTLVNPYTLPYFEKGKWNLNYFRNAITSASSLKELCNTLGIIAPDIEDANYETDVAALNTAVNQRIVRSDNKSLIYGKYFVVRFVFKNDRKIKLDTVDIATNQY